MEIRLAWAVVGIVLGLVMGSAINAMVWRIKVGKSWAHGRSVCCDCGHQLAAKDLVPVLSWLLLGGKCRYCRKPIKDHPIVELVTAIVFGLSAYVMAAPATVVGWVALVGWLVIATMLIILAAYDARWMILPNKIMFPLIGVAIIYAVTLSVLARDPKVVMGAVIAAALAGGGFWFLEVASKGRAMGGGDTKLAFAMGLILGVQGTAIALFLAFDVAAVVGLIMIGAHRRRRTDLIPFGPYLVGGTVLAYLFGRAIVNWYLQMNGVSL